MYNHVLGAGDESGHVLVLRRRHQHIISVAVTDDTVACAAQPAFDGPLMTSARQQYDRLCLALSLDRLPLGLRNPMPLA